MPAIRSGPRRTSRSLPKRHMPSSPTTGICAGDATLAASLALARRWLRPGGLFVFIDALPAALQDAEPSGAAHAPAELTAALVEAGFTEVAVATTSRCFVLGHARAGGESTVREGDAAVRETE